MDFSNESVHANPQAGLFCFVLSRLFDLGVPKWRGFGVIYSDICIKCVINPSTQHLEIK